MSPVPVLPVMVPVASLQAVSVSTLLRSMPVFTVPSISILPCASWWMVAAFIHCAAAPLRKSCTSLTQLVALAVPVTSARPLRSACKRAVPAVSTVAPDAMVMVFLVDRMVVEWTLLTGTMLPAKVSLVALSV